MIYPIKIQEIKIGSASMQLIMQDEQTPIVQFNQVTFHQVWPLVQQFPDLCNLLYIKEFAKISNFLWKNTQFQVVESIRDFQNNYLDQVEMEKRCPGDIFPYRLTDFKIFDISVMHEPIVDQEQLIFFVFQVSTGLPYRVVCPFPYIAASTVVHYQILPIKDESIHM